MGMVRPTGGYTEQMLEPGGWPEIDEDAFYDRAQEYLQVLRQVTEVLETCKHERAELFDGGAWSGSAAGAANGELETNIGELVTLQNGLATVITWQRHIAMSIVQAKSDITDNVEAAQRRIDVLENDADLEPAQRTTAINTVVLAAHGANVGVIDVAAERILASKTWRPPGNAVEDLLDQKTPPPVAIPDTESPAAPPPANGERPGHGTTEPAPATPTPPPPVRPGAPPLSPPGSPTPGVAPPPPSPAMPLPPGQAPGSPSPAPIPGGPGGAGPGTPSAPGEPPSGPAAPAATPAPLGPAVPAAPLSPAASGVPAGAGGVGKGMAPASVAAPSPSSHSEDTSSPGAPGGAPGMPAAPMAAGASGGASGGSAAGARALAGEKPASAQPSTRPAAANRAAGKAAPAARRKAADQTEPPADVVAAAPIPVSAARAERDAIAEAATADAARRQGDDPLRLARRVAAALNAPGGGGGGDLGFFWVTAVTADGAIVVANSYGLAYIPAGVQLPEQVHMASADETIPATERARWATYPVMAVQGWATHHDTTLRAVIGTEHQLANSDPGAPKVLLKPDDIPANGDMAGRPRLQVVDPDAAERLAATTDLRLIDLLPPAPADPRAAAGPRPTSEVTDSEAVADLADSLARGTVDAQQLLAAMPATPVEAGPPADERPMLWFDVMKPLASKSTGRQAAHLRAFLAYATHVQEVVLKEAHGAVDLAEQRSAVADWLYWKHVGALLQAGLADGP